MQLNNKYKERGTSPDRWKHALFFFFEANESHWNKDLWKYVPRKAYHWHWTYNSSGRRYPIKWANIMKKCLKKRNKYSCFISSMQHRIVIPQTSPHVHIHMGHTQPDHEINKSRSKPRVQDAYTHYRAFLLKPTYASTLSHWNIGMYIYLKNWWHPCNPVKRSEEKC